MIYHTLPDRRSDIGDYVEKVRAIVNEVRQGGDNALIKLTERLDGVKLSTVKATKEEIDEASAKLPHRIATDIDVIFKHLYDFHSQTKPPNQGISQSNLVIDLVWEPIRRVGIYVPKGRNSYPSTLLMTGVPAIVAGVDELYVASAPSVSGLDPAVAYISKKMGVREIYRLGGPQAIAAMAFGTESVAKVDKIVGPGGLFVQAAKLLVSQWVGIDGIEGPTELVIVADESADSRLVAHDLLAQAEHGPNTVLVLLSTSEAVLKEVERAIQSSGSPRMAIT
ncbi:hypothetical protein HS1genome_2370 [Sulfodiicoccus acidiphilus]|uniref:Histidinol dehydrogenase n=1 Tax=Sulfodiicoccus acidiphilus TaxID=1670455 RepID=A0A348B729_9CREN|nr:hypothetical protein HS1genome_2370 [Sulfodiicoccus acidiphilus]